MIAEIKPDLARLVILDISGVYSRIHNEGYFSSKQVEDILSQYSDQDRWRVVEIKD